MKAKSVERTKQYVSLTFVPKKNQNVGFLLPFCSNKTSDKADWSDILGGHKESVSHKKEMPDKTERCDFFSKIKNTDKKHFVSHVTHQNVLFEMFQASPHFFIFQSCLEHIFVKFSSMSQWYPFWVQVVFTVMSELILGQWEVTQIKNKITFTWKKEALRLMGKILNAKVNKKNFKTTLNVYKKQGWFKSSI